MNAPPVPPTTPKGVPEPSSAMTVGEMKAGLTSFVNYLTEHSKVLQPQLVGALDTIRRLQEDSPLARQLAAIVDSANSAQKSLAEAVSARVLLAPTNFQLPTNWDASLQQVLRGFREFGKISLPKIDWDAIRERDELAMRAAARRNWFIQPETEAVFLVRVMEFIDTPEQFDARFAGVIKRDLDDIRARLMTSFPKRAQVIGEAFALHAEKRYLASVPLMLLSAEGIAWDVTGKSVFTAKSKGKPQIAPWLAKAAPDGYKKALTAGLSTDHPLSVPQAGHLNRHHVLHGRDTNYGNEGFALQAVSFLGSVGWVFAPEGLLAEKLHLS